MTLQFSTVPWVVFRDEPRPDDIRQGGVGNCWFVCALSCLAEYPDALKQIIPTHEYNPAGAYQVLTVRARVRAIVTVRVRVRVRVQPGRRLPGAAAPGGRVNT